MKNSSRFELKIARNFDPLQERVGLVLRFFQDARIELSQLNSRLMKCRQMEGRAWIMLNVPRRPVPTDGTARLAAGRIYLVRGNGRAIRASYRSESIKVVPPGREDW